MRFAVRIHRSVTIALCLLASVSMGCGESEPVRAEARVQPDQSADAQRSAASVHQQRAPIAQRDAQPIEPRAAPTAHVRIEPPAALDLRDLEPAAFVEAIERIQGPLESGHYIVEGGSEVVVDGRAERVEGALSLLDCRPIDPRRPERGARLWVGGLRLDRAPEVFEPQFEERLALPIFGDPDISLSAGWSDLALHGGVLSGLARTLAAGIDEETPEQVTMWQRDLMLDPSQPNEAVPGEIPADGGCPDELTLSLRVAETLRYWEPPSDERPGGRPYSRRVEEVAELGRATLHLRRVSYVPEIVDRSQRALRVDR